MELLAPAGNIEKLYYAYKYGADAAYIGIRNFSLRARADNFHNDEWEKIKKIKGSKKLYGALNIFFHNNDIKNLEEQINYLALYPFDAFIISDIGILPLLRKYFPSMEFHLSTQANCINTEAARMYYDLGFSRIIPGRETSLSEIAEIKSALPELEIETFVHGAMCMAYSGRCFLSKFLSDRSANQGDCSHSCRWKYRLLENNAVIEEEERPGEYFPVIEGDNFTTIMSSKDLCMIDHLADLRNAGVDSLKIEGRMKSIYYTAVVTRAYRQALFALENNKNVESWSGYRDELFNVSHREFSTGFFYSNEEIQKPTELSYVRKYLFLGSLGEEIKPGVYSLIIKNHIDSQTKLEFVGPDILSIEENQATFFDENFQEITAVNHGNTAYIKPSVPVEPGYIMRTPIA